MAVVDHVKQRFNADLAPDTAMSTGFQATHTGDTGAPTSFEFNGRTCTAG